MPKNAGEYRRDFLIAMYNQMMNDINRHIIVVWQSVSILFGAFAVLALVEKKTISFDIATCVILLLAMWVIAHTYDASLWYNRNLAIIANIERQFLRQSDLHDIHPYFGAHRASKMITHLQLQRNLALGVASLIIAVGFFQYTLPAILKSCISITTVAPYCVLLFGIYVWWRAARSAKARFATFMNNSPGKTIDASGMVYGRGHPTTKTPTPPPKKL